MNVIQKIMDEESIDMNSVKTSNFEILTVLEN